MRSNCASSIATKSKSCMVDPQGTVLDHSTRKKSRKNLEMESDELDIAICTLDIVRLKSSHQRRFDLAFRYHRAPESDSPSDAAAAVRSFSPIIGSASRLKPPCSKRSPAIKALTPCRCFPVAGKLCYIHS